MKNFLIIVALFLPSQLFAQSIQQNVVVIFDDSSSMENDLGRGLSRIEAAKQSLTKVLTNLPANTNIGIILLNGNWGEKQWFVPFAPLNKNSLAQKISTLRANGGTPLGGCMKAGCDVLLEKRDRQKYGTYKLLIVTDGEAGDAWLVEKYTPDIMTRGVTVDVIGVGMQSKHTLATKVNSYQDANNPNQLTQALQATFAEVSYKDKASAEEDFQMLSGMPDNMPAKIIDALMDSGNHPIGEIAKIKNKQTSIPSNTSNANDSTEIPPAAVGAMVVLGVCVAFLFVFVAFNLLS